MPQSETDYILGWATHVRGASNRNDVVNHRNPLLGLSTDTLPPSILAYLNHMACESCNETLDTADDDNCGSLPWESLNSTALNAIGVILEQALTTSLLPLAAQHVKRCRDLELKGGAEQAFVDWTLPPEEAIAKVCLQNRLQLLPSFAVVRGRICGQQAPNQRYESVLSGKSSRYSIRL
jgi:hypothetical protein